MGANTSRLAGRRAAAERAEVRLVLDGIRGIVQALRHVSHDTERRTGLSAAQLFVLSRLDGQDGLSLNQLAERTFTHQSSVSTVVTRLVAAGLVARRVAADDRRRLVLALTPAGRRVLAAAPDPAQDALIAAVGVLPSAARRQLGRSLAALVRALEPSSRKVRMFFDDPHAKSASSRRRRRSVGTGA